MTSVGETLALVPRSVWRSDAAKGLDALPESPLFIITMKLDCAQDVCSFEAVNKFCRSVSSDNAVWKKLCCDKFGAPLSAQPPSWKALYRFNHQYLYGVIFTRRFGRALHLPNGFQLILHVCAAPLCYSWGAPV